MAMKYILGVFSIDGKEILGRYINPIKAQSGYFKALCRFHGYDPELREDRETVRVKYSQDIENMNSGIKYNGKNCILRVVTQDEYDKYY